MLVATTLVVLYGVARAVTGMPAMLASWRRVAPARVSTRTAR